MKENKTGKGKRGAIFFLKIAGGIVLLVITALFAILMYYVYLELTISFLWIHNKSEFGVRFQTVTVDGKVVWDKPDAIIAPGSSIDPRFRAPAKIVALKVVAVNERHEEETLFAELDNRRPPGHFSFNYTKGSLVRRR